MNMKLFQVAISILNDIMVALADGKLTLDEIINIIIKNLTVFGIKVEGRDVWGFEARDGSLYFRLDKALMDKLSVKVNVE